MENKQNKVIEPEILDESGNKIMPKPYIAEEELKQKFNTVRKGVIGLLGGFVSLVTGAMMFCVFLVIVILFAIPLFILSLFGSKPNIKIFKYRI